MSRRAFLDLKEKELSVYLAGKNGKAGFAPDVPTAAVGPGYSFSIGNINGETEESFLSLPLSLLNFRILEYPFSDMKKIRELVPFGIDGLILGGSGNVIFDAVVLGRKDGSYSVLVAYVMKETLRTILETLKAGGFDPAVVTCLELSHILAAAPAGEIADLLVSPPPLTAEQRMNAAMREMDRPALNLRRDEFAYTVDTEKTRKSLRVAMAMAALVLAVFLADTAMTIFSVKKENAQIRTDIRKTYLGLFPGETKISNELYQLRAHMKEMKERESSFIGVSPLQTLLGLSRFAGPGLSLNEVTMERDIVVLRGECPSLSDVQKYANNLGGAFRDVVISDTKPSAQNRILFTITAKVKKA
jgi:hypothetical protein